MTASRFAGAAFVDQRLAPMCSGLTISASSIVEAGVAPFMRAVWAGSVSELSEPCLDLARTPLSLASASACFTVRSSLSVCRRRSFNQLRSWRRLAAARRAAQRASTPMWIWLPIILSGDEIQVSNRSASLAAGGTRRPRQAGVGQAAAL